MKTVESTAASGRLTVRLVRFEAGWGFVEPRGDMSLLERLFGAPEVELEAPVLEQRVREDYDLAKMVDLVRSVARDRKLAVWVYAGKEGAATLVIRPRVVHPPKPPAYRKGWINNIDELTRELGEDHLLEPRRATQDIEAGLSRRVYKSTACGAWLAFARGPDRKVQDQPVSISVGSIVEGIDAETDTATLIFPFTRKQFWDALEGVEKEADDLWNETHGCPGCWSGAKNAEGWPIDEDAEEMSTWPIDDACPSCGGDGRIM